ncbi:MAG: magnesium transporter [Candidatus Nanoarchaeia archaeon]|jgi:magnesium transporter
MAVNLLLKKYIIENVPLIGRESTVKDVLVMLEKRSMNYDFLDCIYVVGKDKELLGFLSIEELFNNKKSEKLKNLMQTNIIHAYEKTNIEQVADLALKYNLKAVPVLDSKKLVGVIPSKKILSIVNKTLREDLFHFAGIHKSHLDFENSLEIPIVKSIKDRLYWLIFGLAGSMFIAFYMGLFEETLSTYVIIAAFVPAIVYMSDALGTQIQTIFVRDIAVIGKDLDLKKYFLRQLIISFFIAVTLSLLMFICISWFWKQSFIALAISLAVFFSLIFACITSFFITLGIKKFKFDPALGSGPVATIISDATSVIVYFIVVMLML